MAKRYGILPSEILKLDWQDFEFTLLVCATALDEERRIQAKQERLHAQQRNRLNGKR